MKLKTIFLGTPDFSIPAIELLLNHPSIELKSVVTMPDRPSGRGQQLTSPPVATFAKENKINLLQTDNINLETTFLDTIKKEKVDLIVVLAFAQFLNSKVLAIPRLGCFNIHTSLLPKYRGAAPIQHAIINGDKFTGVSIQKMVKKMDAGDIVFSRETPIGKAETGGMLYTRLKYLAALGLSDFLNDVTTNNINFTPQNEEEASFAPSIEKEQGYLDFINYDAETLYNKIRGFNPRPSCYLNLLLDSKKKRLKIFEATIEQLPLRPGEINTIYGTLQIGCKNGTLRLTRVQLEGKKAGNDGDFLNGIKNNSIDLNLT